ncbi:MAG: DMT family transporter [Algisphaera sp.]
MTRSTPPPPSPSSDRTGLLFAAGSAALFSLKGVAVKLGLQHGLNVEQMMTWRMTLALPVFLAVGITAAKKRNAFPTTRVLFTAAGLGVLSYYVCTWLDFSGLRHLSAQFERMILFTYPTLTAVLAWVLLGERFTRRHAVSLVVSYAGILLMFGFEAQSLGTNVARGATLVFSAALLFALYVVLAKATITTLGSKLFTCIAMTAATLAIITHQLVTQASGTAPNVAFFSTPAIAIGLFMAVVCTVLPSFMLSEALARIGPARASATGSIGPVVTTVAAVVVLGEPFGLPQAGGLALILLGVGMLTRAKTDAKPKEKGDSK